MNVTVDKNVCIGCGACTGIAEGIFEIGQDNLAEVVKNEVNDDVRSAAECCPTGAIIIEEEDN